MCLDHWTTVGETKFQLSEDRQSRQTSLIAIIGLFPLHCHWREYGENLIMAKNRSVCGVFLGITWMFALFRFWQIERRWQLAAITSPKPRTLSQQSPSGRTFSFSLVLSTLSPLWGKKNRTYLTSTMRSMIRMTMIAAAAPAPAAIAILDELDSEAVRREKRLFSRLARPIQHQRTLFNWGDANSQ